MKLQALASACNFIKKETLAQALSSEFCEISKNTFSYRTPQVAASEQSQASKMKLFSEIVAESSELFSLKAPS